MSYRKVFTQVTPLDDYRLKIEMETGNIINFDFRTRLRSARFACLLDEGVFNSVRTDGMHLIFYCDKKEIVKIAASDFMDLLMWDRTEG